jgi:ketosteroid isomerase-like protein
MQATARVSIPFVLCLTMALSQGPTMAAQGSSATGDVVARFNDAINRHDPAAVAALLTDDTVFENTGPVPDGARIVGKAAVAAFWEKWFVSNADATFDAEEIIVSGDRCIVRWVYRKMRDGKPWHLRGIDVFTVRDGRIAAKLAYVKG